MDNENGKEIIFNVYRDDGHQPLLNIRLPNHLFATIGELGDAVCPLVGCQRNFIKFRALPGEPPFNAGRIRGTDHLGTLNVLLIIEPPLIYVTVMCESTHRCYELIDMVDQTDTVGELKRKLKRVHPDRFKNYNRIRLKYPVPGYELDFNARDRTLESYGIRGTSLFLLAE